MNFKNLTAPQREALLELALLAMYADGHLATSEDDRVHRLLNAMGPATEFEQTRHYDAAVTRVRTHTQTVAAARAQAAVLAEKFTEPQLRRDVVAVLDELVASDREVAAEESGYMKVVREAFQL